MREGPMKLVGLFLSALLLTSFDLRASELERAWKDTDTWRAEGEMLSLRISKGNPWRIFVVGREEAKIDPATLKLTVRRLKPYPGRVIAVDRKGEHFEMGTNAREIGEIEEIEIKTIMQGGEETFRIRLKPDAGTSATPKGGK